MTLLFDKRYDFLEQFFLQAYKKNRHLDIKINALRGLSQFITEKEIKTSIVQLEDFLKALFRLEQGDGFVKLEEIAKEAQLPISQAKDALKDLSELNVIKHVTDKGVKLAEKGRIWAMGIVRKHRLTEDFLINLGLDLSEAHPIAEKLEHLISEDGERQLEQSLGRRVPGENDDPPKNGEMPLSSLDSPCRVIISRIVGTNEKLIRHLVSVGVIPGITARVKKRSNSNSPLILRIGGFAGGFEVAVGKEVAANIMVKPMPARRRRRRSFRRRHRGKRNKT